MYILKSSKCLYQQVAITVSVGIMLISLQERLDANR